MGRAASKLHAFFGGWIGIVMCAILFPIIIVRTIDHTFTWWGGFMCIGFTWLFSRGAYLERQRKDKEAKERVDLNAEVVRLREENEKLKRKVMECCEHSSLH
jgi:hypothetical protein